jgi:LPXTG-motif cell wall-anchored protein
MRQRLLKVMCVAVLTLVGFAGTASAYPPGGSTVVQTDKSSYTVGSSVVITAAGFAACAGQVVTFTLTPPAGSNAEVIVLTAIADANGIATVQLLAPPFLGTWTVVATSAGCPDASTVFNVVTRSRLPSTGTNSQQWVTTAIAVSLTGVGFWFVARRRRRPSVAE